MNEYPPVLTADQVAELLHMSIDTVRRLSREGVIPSHRIPGGRVFRYLTDEVLAWVAELPSGEDTG